MPTNLTSLGRKLPQRTDYLSVVSPQGDAAEVYTFNPVIEKVNETNLDAFRKRQLNSAPSVINVEQGIGGTIAPAINYRTQELWNFIPNNNNPLKKIDKYNTERVLRNQQLALLEGEEAARQEGIKARNAQNYIDAYWGANNGARNNLWNRNMDTLKSLGVTMDDIRYDYYQKHPTLYQQGMKIIAQNVDSRAKDKFGGNGTISVNKDETTQEAKRLITNELKRMNAAGELTKDVSRTKRLIDLYNKLK